MSTISGRAAERTSRGPAEAEGFRRKSTENKSQAREHTVCLVDRKKLSLTGVEDVDCFNEQLVVLRTPLGTLTVAGAGLNVSQLTLEDGRVEIDGEVDALEYSGGKKKSGGLLGRLFR